MAPNFSVKCKQTLITLELRKSLNESYPLKVIGKGLPILNFENWPSADLWCQTSSDAGGLHH